MRPFFDIKNPDARIRLYKQDCLVGMEHELEPRSVSAVVTSPPSNIGIRYSKYNDRPEMNT